MYIHRTLYMFDGYYREKKVLASVSIRTHKCEMLTSAFMKIIGLTLGFILFKAFGIKI